IARVTIPGRTYPRRMYERAVASRVIPQPTYGFSRGSRSTASPYACIDQFVPFAFPLHGDGTASRHSNDAVTSPFWSGCGPYIALNDISRIGKRIAYSFRKTFASGDETASLTTIWPRWVRWSKP